MTREDRVSDLRSQSEKDCDRILYSSAFRRLAGVTQVVPVGEVPLFHNRLTHTMKVAQLAERLAQDLIRGGFATEDQVDCNVAKAAGLAHDLGHPPFGHVTEAVLKRLCTAAGVDGFEGNPQSFRIVTKLARGASPTPGMRLSNRTLNAILKYPWLRPENPPSKYADIEERYHWEKWGAYRSESSTFKSARGVDTTNDQCIEAAIMDWCDDISYALHDVEDFYRVAVLPLDRLALDHDWFLTSAARELSSNPRFKPDLLALALEHLTGLLPMRSYSGRDEARETLHRMTNRFIDDFFAAGRVSSDGKRLIIEPTAWHEVMLLKQLTWQYVVNNPALASLQRGQEHLISVLFERIMGWLGADDSASRETLDRLPARLRRIFELVQNEAEDLAWGECAVAARSAADYIATLTEDQAVDLFKRVTGVSTGSVLDSWIRW